MAVDLHRPFPHLKGQYRLPRWPGSVNKRKKKFGTDFDPQRWGGSSLPSAHEMMALQNSYSGRHSPLLHRNVCSGHLIRKINFELYSETNHAIITYLPDRNELHPISSSPWEHCFFPSHNAALETHRPLIWHLKASFGHSLTSSRIRFKLHSSSEPSLQSGRPSQTKYQLMQTPLDRHWKVPAEHPVFWALHNFWSLSTECAQSHRLSALQYVYGSANWQCWSLSHFKPRM